MLVETICNSIEKGQCEHEWILMQHWESILWLYRVVIWCYFIFIFYFHSDICLPNIYYRMPMVIWNCIWMFWCLLHHIAYPRIFITVIYAGMCASDIQWNLRMTTTFKMKSIACGSFSNAIYLWLEIHNCQSYHTLSSGAHPGGQWSPGWAPEDRQVKYKAVVVGRFHCTYIERKFD